VFCIYNHCLKEIITAIQQVRIKSIKSDRKYVYIVTITMLFWTFYSKNPEKKWSCLHKNIKQHNHFNEDNKKNILSSKSAY